MYIYVQQASPGSAHPNVTYLFAVEEYRQTLLRGKMDWERQDDNRFTLTVTLDDEPTPRVLEANPLTEGLFETFCRWGGIDLTMSQLDIRFDSLCHFDSSYSKVKLVKR